jgi:hypothetical protein
MSLCSSNSAADTCRGRARTSSQVKLHRGSRSACQVKSSRVKSCRTVALDLLSETALAAHVVERERSVVCRDVESDARVLGQTAVGRVVARGLAQEAVQHGVARGAQRVQRVAHPRRVVAAAARGAVGEVPLALQLLEVPRGRLDAPKGLTRRSKSVRKSVSATWTARCAQRSDKEE